MEMHISQSIVMRIKEFGESDLLVTFITPDRGPLKGVAKGARRSKKRFANCLDLFCWVNLEYGPRRNTELHFLDSCRLIHAFPGLRSDFYALSSASYMVELVEILYPQNVVDNHIFNLLKESLLALEEGGQNDILRMGFEANIMALGGYGINLERCCICGRAYTGTGRALFLQNRGGIACLKCEQESARRPGMGPDAVKNLKVMQSKPWNDVRDISLTEADIEEIKPVLKLHMDYRIGKRLKSAKFLE